MFKEDILKGIGVKNKDNFGSMDMFRIVEKLLICDCKGIVLWGV